MLVLDNLPLIAFLPLEHDLAALSELLVDAAELRWMLLAESESDFSDEARLH